MNRIPSLKYEPRHLCNLQVISNLPSSDAVVDQVVSNLPSSDAVAEQVGWSVGWLVVEQIGWLISIHLTISLLQVVANLPSTDDVASVLPSTDQVTDQVSYFFSSVLIIIYKMSHLTSLENPISRWWRTFPPAIRWSAPFPAQIKYSFRTFPILILTLIEGCRSTANR